MNDHNVMINQKYTNQVDKPITLITSLTIGDWSMNELMHHEFQNCWDLNVSMWKCHIPFVGESFYMQIQHNVGQNGLDLEQ